MTAKTRRWMVALVTLAAVSCGTDQTAPPERPDTDQSTPPDRAYYITTGTGPVYVTSECQTAFDAAQDTYPRVTEEWRKAATALSQAESGEETVEFAAMTAQLHMDLAAYWLHTAAQHKDEAERECSGAQAVGITNLPEMHQITEELHQGGIQLCRQFVPLMADLDCDDLGAHLID